MEIFPSSEKIYFLAKYVIEIITITNFVKRVAKHKFPPIDAARRHTRARLGEIEPCRYARYVNLCSTRGR